MNTTFSLHRLFLLVALLASAACSHNIVAHGVPNLVQVRPNVWRSGQPTADGWRYLAAQFAGRRVHVLKLDFESEGTDEPARALGWDVRDLGIEPRTDPDGLVPMVAEVFEKPAADVWREIVRQIGSIPEKPGLDLWLIHCVNGHDRTGLVVGHVRVLVDRWSKELAWREMVRLGYHRGLVGLDRQWADLKIPK